MTLNCPLKAGKRIPINLTGHFATLGANVVAINFCCFDEIHYVKSKYLLNQNPISSIFSFHLLTYAHEGECTTNVCLPLQLPFLAPPSILPKNCDTPFNTLHEFFTSFIVHLCAHLHSLAQFLRCPSSIAILSLHIVHAPFFSIYIIFLIMFLTSFSSWNHLKSQVSYPI